MSPVLMISYSGSFGGAERVLIDFAQALDGERCLACPEGPLAAAARGLGIRVLPLAARSPETRASPAAFARAVLALGAHRHEVRDLIRDLEPELVLVNGMRPGLAALLPSPPRDAAPIVFVHHDMVPGAAIGTLVRRAARRAALVVVPSRAVALDLGPRVPALVVYPGVDIDRFPAGHDPEQPPRVLVLGALVGWKRPELALDVFARARTRVPAARLRYVGAPVGRASEALVAQLRARAAEPDLGGSVEFVGAVDDPAEELARASCLLHCATREPFGMAVLEALAAGRAVVAPAEAGPEEIVDESCGLLYPPGDAVAAADAVASLLERPALAAELGAAGRARARDQFSLTTARERLAAAVAPLASRRHGPVQRFAGDPASVALVTVTHNSADELEALLDSTARHLPGAKVVVVDCASVDSTVAVASRGRDGITVEVIALERNVGFGTACNAGVRAVAEPITALVNPDVELLDGSLLELVEAARRDDRLLAPLVLSPDGSRQDTVHPAPSGVAELVSTVVPPVAIPGRAGAALAPWRGRAARRVGWAVGCALVARTETLLALGPFDERIFLYGEDLNLGLRAAEAGIETWFWPAARVLHTGGHSTRKAFASEPVELLARARHDAVARALGERHALLDDRAQEVTFLSRIAFKRALGRDTRTERRRLEAVRSVRRPE